MNGEHLRGWGAGHDRPQLEEGFFRRPGEEK